MVLVLVLICCKIDVQMRTSSQMVYKQLLGFTTRLLVPCIFLHEDAAQVLYISFMSSDLTPLQGLKRLQKLLKYLVRITLVAWTVSLIYNDWVLDIVHIYVFEYHISHEAIALFTT